MQCELSPSSGGSPPFVSTAQTHCTRQLRQLSFQLVTLYKTHSNLAPRVLSSTVSALLFLQVLLEEAAQGQEG